MAVDAPHEPLLERYVAGADRLAAALEGLDEADLDLAGADGWSIRALVHRAAEVEAAWTHPIKMAMAEPGRPYAAAPFDPALWAERLNYAARPVGPSLRLLRATRCHLAVIAGHLPGALEHAAEDSALGPLTVRERLERLAGMAEEHAESIRAVRRAHGR